MRKLRTLRALHHVRQKAFTLVEALIVLGIVGMLVGVLFRTYLDVSRVYFKTDAYKAVATTYTSLVTTLQTMVDGFEVNTAFYEQKLKEAKYQTKKGEDLFSFPFFFISGDLTNVLALRNDKGDFLYVYPQGDCVSFSGNQLLFARLLGSKQCWLEGAGVEGNQVKTGYLTDPSTTYVSNVVFKILPKTPLSRSNYSTGDEDLYFQQKQAFWLLGDLRARYRMPEWTRNVSLKMQMFFELK